jgi:hypothetical protein
MVSQEWWLHLDNAPVHTTGSVVDFLAAKGVKMVPHLLCLPYHTPAAFSLFPRAKAELAGLMLMQETFKNTWGGEYQVHCQGKLRHRLQALNGVVQKVHPDRRELCQKLTRNK